MGPGLVFRAADGYVIMAGVRSPERLAALWKLVERADLPAQDERYLQQFPDADFVFDEVIPAIEVWSSTRPKWEVAGKLTEIGFSMGVTQSVADLADCPQLQARGMYTDTDDTLGGSFRSLSTPFRLTACEPSPGRRSAHPGRTQCRDPLHVGWHNDGATDGARSGRRGLINYAALAHCGLAA